MTLKTSIAIHEAMPLQEVYAFCRQLLETPDDVEPIRSGADRDGFPYIANPGGIGLSAWLWIYYGADGPMTEACDRWCTEDGESLPTEPCEYHRESPTRNGWAAIDVTFDTAYGYREANGAGCSDLHAWLVTELGRWLDERGKTWKWQNEFTGDWRDRYAALGEFGDVEVGRPGSTVQRTRPKDGHEAFGELVAALVQGS